MVIGFSHSHKEHIYFLWILYVNRILILWIVCFVYLCICVYFFSPIFNSFGHMSHAFYTVHRNIHSPDVSQSASQQTNREWMSNNYIWYVWKKWNIFCAGHICSIHDPWWSQRWLYKYIYMHEMPFATADKECMLVFVSTNVMILIYPEHFITHNIAIDQTIWQRIPLFRRYDRI